MKLMKHLRYSDHVDIPERSFSELMLIHHHKACSEQWRFAGTEAAANEKTEGAILCSDVAKHGLLTET